tara:strand:- start:868 stop:2136 length:1269 start_codon:yes stop_codon:yes gene_type:complete
MARYRSKQLLSTAVNNSTTAVAVGDSDTNISITDTADSPCMINANDIIRLADGSQYHVTSIAASAASKRALTTRALTASTAAAAVLAVGSVVAVVGNAFAEGSLGSTVGEGYAYPETRKNWLTISRKKLVIDARDLTDVTWVEHNGHRLWFFTKEQQTEAQFMYDLEVMRWFGKASIAQYTATTVGSNATSLTDVPVIGDGLLAQISASNVMTYEEDKDLTEDALVEFIGQLSLNAQNVTGNEYVVFTGTQGKIQFHKAMKELLFKDGGNASAILVDKAGQDVAVGANFSTYTCLGNKITLAHCPVFDDPNISAAPGYADGAEILSAGGGFRGANLSGLMVFLDMGVNQGVANIELIAKGAEGMNRNWVKKYVPGMINPYDAKSMLAASGDDRFECHWLTQSGIIVRNPLSCGIFKPTGLVI